MKVSSNRQFVFLKSSFQNERKALKRWEKLEGKGFLHNGKFSKVFFCPKNRLKNLKMPVLYFRQLFLEIKERVS